jgi:hypothetical protein
VSIDLYHDDGVFQIRTGIPPTDSSCVWRIVESFLFNPADNSIWIEGSDSEAYELLGVSDGQGNIRPLSEVKKGDRLVLKRGAKTHFSEGAFYARYPSAKSVNEKKNR